MFLLFSIIIYIQYIYIKIIIYILH